MPSSSYRTGSFSSPTSYSSYTLGSSSYTLPYSSYTLGSSSYTLPYSSYTLGSSIDVTNHERLGFMIPTEVFVCGIVFGSPVAFYWLKRHYNAIEKGAVQPLLQESNVRVQQLERQNKELLERVQNLESIVVALDSSPATPKLPAPQKKPDGE